MEQTVTIHIGAAETCNGDNNFGLYYHIADDTSGNSVNCFIHVDEKYRKASPESKKSGTAEQKDEKPSVPLTPEEIQKINFDKAYPAGWTFLKIDGKPAFMEFGTEVK